MSKRKTIAVDEVVKMVNNMLAKSTVSPAHREGMSLILEDILHKTGNYQGFRYLMDFEVPKGELPGIRFAADGSMLPYEERFKDVDETRRQY